MLRIILNIDLVQDKMMMERWGLEGMRSFEQKGVKAKERERGTIPDEVSSVYVAAGTTASVAEV